jgi:hypothetical protein
MMERIAHKNQIAAFFWQRATIFRADGGFDVMNTQLFGPLFNISQKTFINVYGEHFSSSPGPLSQFKRKVPAPASNVGYNIARFYVKMSKHFPGANLGPSIQQNSPNVFNPHFLFSFSFSMFRSAQPEYRARIRIFQAFS